MSTNASEQNPGAEEGGPAPGHFWLWLASVLGTIIVAGCVGFMVWTALTEKDTPPEVRLAVTRVVSQPGAYLVEFTALNLGSNAAAGLQVSGELVKGSEVVERSETTFENVPGKSQREGGIYFSEDPRQFEIRLRSVGFETP